MSDANALDDDFLAILQCPACGSSLRAEADTVVCTNGDCSLVYPVENGIPHLLISEARSPKDENLKRLHSSGDPGVSLPSFTTGRYSCTH